MSVAFIGGPTAALVTQIPSPRWDHPSSITVEASPEAARLRRSLTPVSDRQVAGRRGISV